MAHKGVRWTKNAATWIRSAQRVLQWAGGPRWLLIVSHPSSRSSFCVFIKGIQILRPSLMDTGAVVGKESNGGPSEVSEPGRQTCSWHPIGCGGVHCQIPHRTCNSLVSMRSEIFVKQRTCSIKWCFPALAGQNGRRNCLPSAAYSRSVYAIMLRESPLCLYQTVT